MVVTWSRGERGVGRLVLRWGVCPPSPLLHQCSFRLCRQFKRLLRDGLWTDEKKPSELSLHFHPESSAVTVRYEAFVSLGLYYLERIHH